MLETVGYVFSCNLMMAGTHKAVLYHILYLLNAGRSGEVLAVCGHLVSDGAHLVLGKTLFFGYLLVGLSYGIQDLFGIEFYFLTASFDDVHCAAPFI